MVGGEEEGIEPILLQSEQSLQTFLAMNYELDMSIPIHITM
jgi:hypothetical protein